MKKVIAILAALAAVAGIAVGVWYFRVPPKLNTEQVESTFLLSADEAQITAIEKAIMTFQARDPEGALAGFNKLLENKDLSEEQKAVVKDLINQVNVYLGRPTNSAGP